MSRSRGGDDGCVRAHEPASSSMRLEEVRSILVTTPLEENATRFDTRTHRCTARFLSFDLVGVGALGKTRSRRVNVVLVASSHVRADTSCARASRSLVIFGRCCCGWAVSPGPNANR